MKKELSPSAYKLASQFRSLRRAMRRGLISVNGWAVPKRPFNNRANTSSRKGIHSRSVNQEKREIYGRLKEIV